MVAASTTQGDNLALSRSGWDAPTRAAEDPAGIGFFAVAGLDVVVRAWSAAAGCGWRARIAGSCWEGRGEIEVIPDAIAAGTEIGITVPEPWSGRSPLPFAPPRATLPVPVSLNGEPLPRQEFRASAFHVAAWRGCRIGVERGGNSWDRGAESAALTRPIGAGRRGAALASRGASASHRCR